MNFSKTMFIALLSIAICYSQSITISGNVREISGDAVAGALVSLQNAEISAITDDLGDFTLTNVSTRVPSPTHRSSVKSSPVQISNNTLSIAAAENTIIHIKVFNLFGRLLVSEQKRVTAGNHLFHLPQLSRGVSLYRVSVGDKHYTLKNIGIAGVANSISSPGHSFSSSHKTKLSANSSDIIDILSVTKDGYLIFGTGVNSYDAEEIEILIHRSEGAVTDADGNEYQTVQIGSQVWTVENLRTTRYTDGTSIIHGEDTLAMESSPTEAGAYLYYESDSAQWGEHGALYNWHAVNTGKLAPEGWRVPTASDWDSLLYYLVATGHNYDGTMTENKIAKSLSAQTGWNYRKVSTGPDEAPVGSPANNSGANNSSGFSALSGYYRFASSGNSASWWTASDSTQWHAYSSRILSWQSDLETWLIRHKMSFLSVRLVKEE